MPCTFGLNVVGKLACGLEGNALWRLSLLRFLPSFLPFCAGCWLIVQVFGQMASHGALRGFHMDYESDHMSYESDHMDYESDHMDYESDHMLAEPPQ